MRTRTSRNPLRISTSMVVGASLMAAAAGGSVGAWLASGPVEATGMAMRLLGLCSAYALTLLLHTEHGEDVWRWMAGNDWIRLLVWVAFGAAITTTLWDLLRLEFVAQMRGFRG